MIKAMAIAIGLSGILFVSGAQAQLRPQIQISAPPNVARITPSLGLRPLTIPDGARFYAGRFIFRQGGGSVPAKPQSAHSAISLGDGKSIEAAGEDYRFFGGRETRR